MKIEVLEIQVSREVQAEDAIKLAVIEAFNEANILKRELARRHGKTENEARRILDPDHHSKLGQLQEMRCRRSAKPSSFRFSKRLETEKGADREPRLFSSAINIRLHHRLWAGYRRRKLVASCTSFAASALPAFDPDCSIALPASRPP